MHNIDACRKVLTDGVQLVRFRKGSLEGARQTCPRCKGTGVKSGWENCDANDRPPEAQCRFMGCKGTGEIPSIPEYDVKDGFTGKRRGWFYLDSFTASAIVAVYDALSEESRASVPYLPFDVLSKFAFKHVR